MEEYLSENGVLSGLAVRNTETGETQQLHEDGAFLAIGLVPENERFVALAETDERGYFASAEDCLTATPGLFVAGDCRRKAIRQVVTASADGAGAAMAACRYLDGV